MGAVSEKAKARQRTRAVWQSMMSRCHNEKHRQYAVYGARGISVCDRWHVFGSFLHDMGFAPVGLQLDREDNDGNYEPGNCRWVTREVNMNNRGVSRLYEFGGEKLSLAQWDRRLGLTPGSMSKRLVTMPATKAFSTGKVPRTGKRNPRDSNASTKVRTCDIPRVHDLLKAKVSKRRIAAWFDVTPTVIQRIAGRPK